MKTTPQKQSNLILILLILAGEAVFILPFVLARIFRPTFLATFEINNLELGTCFSIYGIVAMVSYFFGGPLADKFHPRILISLALFLTAIGGFFMSTFPSYGFMKLLFGYWGFTTIFLFWASMIKATRVWGGTNRQGMAFGFLDGGRGLVAAGFGSLGILIFSIMITKNVVDATLLERKEAFHYVILISSLIVFVIGILVLFFLKSLQIEEDAKFKKENLISFSSFKSVMKLPSVWLLMVIILCAYVGYKMTDVLSLYAKDVMHYDAMKSAKVGTYLLYLRPVVGIFIGLLADKTRASLWLIIGFLSMLMTSLIIVSGIIDDTTTLLFMTSLGLMALGVYAARVLYFAALQEGGIPMALTGTAVGLISIVGFTPDIFVGPIIGMLLDNSPGELGHQHVFMMMSAFAFMGLIASAIFFKLSVSKNL